jgi:hypothetical protein
MRRWGDEGCSQGNPKDTDIEKAPHNSPKKEGKNVEKNCIHPPPLSLFLAEYHPEAAEQFGSIPLSIKRKSSRGH